MKILVVLPRFPYPLDKGDKLRAYHQIVELSKSHEIYLFALSHVKVTDAQRAALQTYCREIVVVHPSRLTSYSKIVCNYFRAKSLQMGYWGSNAARRAVRDMARRIQPDIVYNQMVRTVPLVARLPFKKVMDFQDALSLNTERRMEHSHGLWRAILHYEFKILRSTEYNAFKIFDALTIISEVDSEAIPHKKNGEIHIIPNGVDTDYFSAAANSQFSTLNSQFSICFTGNMSYAPNVDAAQYLVHDVMPLVWQKVPSATLLLAGTDPKPAVRTLASKRVTVSGHLPDIRSAYASAQLFVAPMRIGSGLQNKLLEAMSMQLPCVTTTLAATPLAGAPLLIGDSPAQLADHIVALLQDADLRRSTGDQGRDFVLQHSSWSAAVQPLENIFNALLESK